MKNLVGVFLFIFCVFCVNIGRSDIICTGFVCRDGQCLSSIFDRCDGVTECLDGSDEQYCIICPSGYFCANRQCTSFISDRCDQTCDCTDCSDESNCTIFNGQGIVVSIAVGASIGVFFFVVGIITCIVILIVAIVIATSSRKRTRRTEVTATAYQPYQPPPVVVANAETPQYQPAPGGELKLETSSSYIPPGSQMEPPARYTPPGIQMQPAAQYSTPVTDQGDVTDDKAPMLQN